MNRFLLPLLLLAMAALNSSCGEHSHDAAAHADQATTPADSTSATAHDALPAVTLDNGQRWKANPETTSGIANMVGILNAFEPASGDRPPIYRRRETVTGTFSSVVPWMSDERTQVVAESAEQLGDDVANSMGISAEMVHRMKREGSFPGSGGSAAGSGSGGGAAISGDCSCDCGFREHADELCELFCEEEFAACASQ